MHGVQGQLTGIFKTKSLKEIDVHFQCNQPDFGLKRFTIYLFGQQLLDMKKSKLQHGEAISTAEKYKLRKKSEVVVKKKESNDSTFLDNESGAGELVYSDFVQATKIIPKETERTRTWEAWNAEAVRMFFEALKLHGKNHEAISRYVAEKTKSNPKNYVQVRNFYYNTWGRISGFLNLSHNAPKEAKELFALINFGAWIQKTGSLKIDTNTAELFNELIITGECKMRMEVWKKKSKTFRQFRVQTPECPALRKYLPKDISQSNFIMHDNIVLQLMPHDAWDEYFVIDCGQNPRLKLCVSSKLPIARVFSELEKRWTSSLAFMNGILMPFWFIRLVPDGFKFLRCNAVNNNFNSMKKRAIKRTFSLEFCFPLAEQGECSPFSCSLDADNINEGLTWENSKCISVGQLSVLSGNLQTLRFRYHFCRDSMIDEDRWMDIFACYIRMKLYEEKLKQRMNSMTVATLLREMFLFKSSIEATPLSDDEGDAHNLLSEQQSNSATGAKGTSSKGIASAHNNKKLRRRKRTKKRKKSFQTVITSKLSLIKQHSLDPISLNGEEMRNQISEEIDADVNMNDNLEAPEAASISSESSVSSGEATTSTEQQSEALPVAFGRLLRLVFGQFELLSTRMTRGLVFNVTSNCSGIMIFLFVALMMLGSNSTDESEAPNTRQRHALAAMSQHATVASTSTAATASVTTEGKETEKRLYTQWSKEAWQLFFEGLKLHGKDFESIRLYIAGKLKHEAKTYDQVRYFFYNTMSPTATKEAKELFTLINYYEWFRITQCKVDHTSKEIFTKLVLTGVVELKVNMGRKLGKSKVKIRTPACAALDKFVAANRHLMEVREIVTIQFVPHSHKDDGYVNFHCHQRSHLSLRINSKLPVVSVFRYLQKKWLLDLVVKKVLCLEQDCEQASKRRIILIPDGFFFHNLPTGPKVETKIKKKRKYSLMGCFPSSDSTEPEFGDDGNQELSIYNDGISCEICPSILICHLFEMAGQKETIRLRYKFEENHPEQFYIKGNSAFSFFAGDTLALNRPSLFSKKYIEVAEDVRKLLPGRLTESTSLPSTSCATTSKKLISFRKKSDLSKKVPHTSKAAQAPTQSQRVVVDCEAQIGSSNFRHMPYMAPKVTTASEEASVREKSVASTISYTHYCQQVEVIQPQQKQQQEQEHQQRHAMDSSFSGNDLTSAMFSNELLALETNTPLHAFPSTSLQFADHMDQNTLVLSKETPISVDITETKDTSDVNQSLVQNDDIPKLLMQRQKAHLDGFCDWSLDSSSNLDFGPIDFKETLHDDDTRKI
ncbi:Protein cramped-like [Trichinella pseudospiralis]|uniref:Protein cramped-like n=1 Tax=Trichinella pseudospiralis TaxID=6337 RepID=A0A0V1JAL8_TRIPS|nr:Protein cramped-like [Trichinella pseudospiralis]